MVGFEMVQAARVPPLLVLRLRLGIGRSIFSGGGPTGGGPTGGGPVLHESFLRTWHRLGPRAAHRAAAPAISMPRRTPAAGTAPPSLQRESMHRDPSAHMTEDPCASQASEQDSDAQARDRSEE